MEFLKKTMQHRYVIFERLITKTFTVSVLISIFPMFNEHGNGLHQAQWTFDRDNNRGFTMRLHPLLEYARILSYLLSTSQKKYPRGRDSDNDKWDKIWYFFYGTVVTPTPDIPSNHHKTCSAKKRDKNRHLLGFIQHIYIHFFYPFTNISILFINTLLY